MAEFCRQCSIANFGEDYGDFAGLLSAEDEANGLLQVVLCEGCGPIVVDRAGACHCDDCLMEHGAEAGS